METTLVRISMNAQLWAVLFYVVASQDRRLPLFKHPFSIYHLFLHSGLVVNAPEI